MTQTDPHHPITKEALKDEDNMLGCECGNFCHHSYMVSCNDGNNSCPSCHQAYLNDVVTMYRDLLIELADPDLTHDEVQQRIKHRYIELLGIDEESFDDAEMQLP